MKNNYESIEKIVQKQKDRLKKDQKFKDNEIVLESKNLNLFYDGGKTHALNNINLQIYKNRVTAIIGPSGCGKSSFLRCINRMNDLIDNTSVEGELNFEGTNIYAKTKKVSSKDKEKLQNLKKQLTKYNAAKFFQDKKDSFNFKKTKSKKSVKMDELVKDTKKEVSKARKEYIAEKDRIKQQKEMLKDRDTKAVSVARFPSYKNIADTVTKYDLKVFHEAVELLTKEKKLKRDFNQKRKEARNHLERKIMEEDNRQSESNIREKNRKLKGHFDKHEDYDRLLEEYEKQWRKTKPWKPAEVRTKIGLVFQKPNPFAKSIFENIAFGLRTHGITDPWVLYLAVEKALKDAALWTEVKDRLSDSALSLSGGQQQRLCIARAISLKPTILLMDEPTASLDPIATAKIEELIKELRRKFTIIIVTHSMQQATRVSDYTAFFYQGDLIETGETHKLFKTPSEERTRQYITGKFG